MSETALEPFEVDGIWYQPPKAEWENRGMGDIKIDHDDIYCGQCDDETPLLESMRVTYDSGLEHHWSYSIGDVSPVVNFPPNPCNPLLRTTERT